MKRIRSFLTVAGIGGYLIALALTTQANQDIVKKTGVKNCMKCHSKIPVKGATAEKDWHLTEAGKAYKEKGTVPK